MDSSVATIEAAPAPAAPAVGETNLDKLLSSMEPILHPDTFCFCTLVAVDNDNDKSNTTTKDNTIVIPSDLQYRMKFEESEGTTYILTQQEASRLQTAVDTHNNNSNNTDTTTTTHHHHHHHPSSSSFSYSFQKEFPCRMITLNIHSSLDAVGFLAAITSHLAKKKTGMGVNPVSGFYHDHLFVPEHRVDDAMVALKELIEEREVK
eukprot:CAMPEP_0202444618 /NCGR_PEP_ID=MMETSP1360-20130828/3618_1 /ASSEMBLY_ACC=CAM_ASM_000848 /TAXON_ID=515479 /ORGANISM="Licmophora paradoxa, Strain CCMP2313" /LENGTH=205 /DNA_ID=CAMNT_0049060645 /DNA_START=455 /DNA_END=1072 /DNA_ORIENTATION=-